MPEDKDVEPADLLGDTQESLASLASSESIPNEDEAPTGVGRYKVGNNRYQSSCIGECLDERIDKNSVVRIIDLFVNSLNLKQLGFVHAKRAESAGQPPYPPAILLKLYLYGYQYNVRSGRQLERECRVNLEVMWLLEEQTPRYRTINTFRSSNSKALNATHEEFVLFCQGLGLVGGSRCSIDGSHFKGNVSAKSFITKKGLEEKQAKARAEVQRWRAVLDAEQAIDTAERQVDIEQAKQEINKLDHLQKSTSEQLERLKAEGLTQQSRTDPDARLLRKRGKSNQGYNVQIATDHKNYLVVGDAVTSDANDLQQLHPIAQVVRQRLGLSDFEVVADKGYYSAEAIADCLEDRITPYVAIPEPRVLKESEDRYPRSAFSYDKDNDVYRCPAGELLKPSGKPRDGWQCYRNKAACRVCDYRDRCLTTKGHFRDVYRLENQEQLDTHAQRMKAHPEIYAERAGAVEHPFGTLKQRAGWSHFLVRGKEKVTGEFSLMLLCYNLTRVLNILGFDRFREVLKQRIEALLYIASRLISRASKQRYRLRKISPSFSAHQNLLNTTRVPAAQWLTECVN